MLRESFSYDLFPYPSYTFPQTHPDRLASIGVLYGIPVKTPTDCRVLEIGCGDGTNLLSFAYALPNSEFVGFDLSENHIRHGISAKARIGVENIDLFHKDATQIDTQELGEFDYIIAHGLLSWVPDTVRPHILNIFADCLAPHGIGYISYNTYPGCRIREIAAGIMRTQSDGFIDPNEKVEQGIAFLEAIAGAAEVDSLYQQVLKLELEQIRERSAQNVFHDDLSDFNTPFYFKDFVSMIGPHGLQFLSEADPIASNTLKLSVEARGLLDSVRDDIITFEQYIDLITCRRFRSSLICRSENPIDRAVSDSKVDEFYISSQVSTDLSSVNVTDATPVRFDGSKGASLTVNHPLTKALLVSMKSQWPKAMPFVDLLARAFEIVGISSTEDVSKARTYILQLYLGGFVKFGCYSPTFAAVVGETPVSSAFARWQISEDIENLTTLAGKNLKTLDPILRLIISMLDGTRGRVEIADEILAAIELPLEERERFTAALPDIIEDQLTQIASAGLLVG